MGVKATLLAGLGIALLTVHASATEIRKSGMAADSPAGSVPPIGQGTPEAIAPVDPRYGEMLARPLFSPMRRPIQLAPQTVTPGQLPVLTGVAITPQRRLAVVEYGTPAKSHRVTEGQTIDYGTVERILPDRIVMRARDGAQAEVKLKDAAASLNPDSGAPAPAAPQIMDSGRDRPLGTPSEPMRPEIATPPSADETPPARTSATWPDRILVGDPFPNKQQPEAQPDISTNIGTSRANPI